MERGEYHTSTAAEMQFPEQVNIVLWWNRWDFAAPVLVTMQRAVNRNVQLQLISRPPREGLFSVMHLGRELGRLLR